jgi:CheY-like chemotaxis protein
LIVDDEETVRAIARIYLEKMGFAVATASDGREALRLLRDSDMDVDAIILDLTMPHMDGIEAFRELRRMGVTAPVILSSGYNQQDATQHLAGRGLAGFLQKPYDFASL